MRSPASTSSVSRLRAFVFADSDEGPRVLTAVRIGLLDDIHRVLHSGENRVLGPFADIFPNRKRHGGNLPKPWVSVGSRNVAFRPTFHRNRNSTLAPVGGTDFHHR